MAVSDGLRWLRRREAIRRFASLASHPRLFGSPDPNRCRKANNGRHFWLGRKPDRSCMWCGDYEDGRPRQPRAGGRKGRPASQ